MEWLSVAALGSIGTLISTVIGAIVLLMKDRRSAPIDKKAAEMATTTALTAASKAQVDMAVQLNTILQKDNDQLNKEIAEGAKKLHEWDHWYTGLQIGWLKIREQVSPPTPPNFDDKD